jgi:hypothetical protein
MSTAIIVSRAPANHAGRWRGWRKDGGNFSLPMIPLLMLFSDKQYVFSTNYKEKYTHSQFFQSQGMEFSTTEDGVFDVQD